MNGISSFILEIIRKRKNVINRCTETVQYTGLRISLGILEWYSSYLAPEMYKRNRMTPVAQWLPGTRTRSDACFSQERRRRSNISKHEESLSRDFVLTNRDDSISL